MTLVVTATSLLLIDDESFLSVLIKQRLVKFDRYGFVLYEIYFFVNYELSLPGQKIKVV